MRSQVALIGLLCVLFFSSCKRLRHDGYKITDVVMQRVEIEDMPIQDGYLYLIYPEINEIWTEVSFLSQSAGKSGSVDQVDAVIVEDSAGYDINGWLVPVNTYKGEKYNNMYLYELEDHSYAKKVSWYDGNIHDWLKKNDGRYGDMDLFSISSNAPVPEYIVVQFPNRVIRAKVNNNAMRYQIKEVWFE